MHISKSCGDGRWWKLNFLVESFLNPERVKPEIEYKSLFTIPPLTPFCKFAFDCIFSPLAARSVHKVAALKLLSVPLDSERVDSFPICCP